MTREEIQLRILRLLQEEPELSQRQLAERLGVSVGSAHYCLKALIEKGSVKAQNFAHNPNKRGYLYQLTPRGLREKAQITRRFLARKRAEYEALRAEIDAMEAELSTDAGPEAPANGKNTR